MMLKQLFILEMLRLCYASKILLVFPIPGTSHGILGEGYVRHLLDAGHEVTYITPLPRLKPSPNLRQIDLSANYELGFLDVINVEKLMRKEVDLSNLYNLKSIMVSYANATMANPNVKKIMNDPNERFDVVIVEWLYTEIYAGFASLFDCPLIWSSSMDPHTMVLWLIDEPPNVAYTQDTVCPEKMPFNFWQRVKNLWHFLQIMYLQWSTSSLQESIYNDSFGPSANKRGVKLSPFNEVIYNGSLMLGNSHVSLGLPIRLPQNYKPILGYHIPQKIPALPKNIQQIMDNASNGVIYFSMGSMLKSKTFPSAIKKGLLEMFGELKQTVLWKFEEELPDKPKNVHIVQWAPQHSILTHPNCVLFITHGGLLSLTEAVHFAVPVIGVPMFADQFANIDRAVTKGFAKRVDLDWDFVANIKAAIGDMTTDSRYHSTVKELSFIYHDRPASPGTELVHWVEHVVKTRGAPHLRSPALNVPLYQKLYLDLAAIVLATVVTLTFAVREIFKKKYIHSRKQKKH